MLIVHRNRDNYVPYQGYQINSVSSLNDSELLSRGGSGPPLETNFGLKFVSPQFINLGLCNLALCAHRLIILPTMDGWDSNYTWQSPCVNLVPTGKIQNYSTTSGLQRTPHPHTSHPPCPWTIEMNISSMGGAKGLCRNIAEDLLSNKPHSITSNLPSDTNNSRNLLNLLHSFLEIFLTRMQDVEDIYIRECVWTQRPPVPPEYLSVSAQGLKISTALSCLSRFSWCIILRGARILKMCPVFKMWQNPATLI